MLIGVGRRLRGERAALLRVPVATTGGVACAETEPALTARVDPGAVRQRQTAEHWRGPEIAAPVAGQAQRDRRAVWLRGLPAQEGAYVDIGCMRRLRRAPRHNASPSGRRVPDAAARPITPPAPRQRESAGSVLSDRTGETGCRPIGFLPSGAETSPYSVRPQVFPQPPPAGVRAVITCRRRSLVERWPRAGGVGGLRADTGRS